MAQQTDAEAVSTDVHSSDSGPVVRDDVSGTLFVVASKPAENDPNAQVELETLEDGEWYGIFQDNYHRNYEFVAETVADVQASDRQGGQH